MEDQWAHPRFCTTATKLYFTMVPTVVNIIHPGLEDMKEELKRYADSEDEKLETILKEYADNEVREHEAPLGTITAWVAFPSTNGTVPPVALPDGWRRCDGSLIPAPSIWEGKVTPNLNGERRFLRGGSDADMLKLEEDQLQEHTHKVTDPGHQHHYYDRYSDNNSYDNDGPSDGQGTFAAAHSYWTDWGFSGSITSNKKGAGGPQAYFAGISVDGVEDIYRRGDETRPKNMNVIYIIKVW